VPDVLFAALSAATERRLAQWKRGQGFAEIRADWLKRAAGLGEMLQVRLPERELSGRFDGLDDGGRLLLDQGGTITVVTAGEVFGFGER
jgi:BirA family biotin operon repressor/biotin-[acetyl-CoA-carboxylase] ligase